MKLGAKYVIEYETYYLVSRDSPLRTSAATLDLGLSPQAGEDSIRKRIPATLESYCQRSRASSKPIPRMQ